MAKPRTQYEFVVRSAQAVAIRAELENMRSGGYKVAELAGPLVDDAGLEYYTFSGNFSDAQLRTLKAAVKKTRILKGTSWWEGEGREVGKVRRDRKLRSKDG